jgi:hypothetical protein
MTGEKPHYFHPTQIIRLSPKTNCPINTMEANMLYKTIILEFLQRRPQMHEQLRKNRKLLPALESYARELKSSHESWKEELSQARPGSDPNQIASEAMEIALKELQDRLPSVSPKDGSEALFLDAAMMFTRRHTSPG